MAPLKYMFERERNKKVTVIALIFAILLTSIIGIPFAIDCNRHKPHSDTTTRLLITAATTQAARISQTINPRGFNRPPTLIEVLPDREIAIIQGEHHVLYTLKQLNKLQFFLQQCFALSKKCHIRHSNQATCPLMAQTLNFRLCLDKNKSVMYAEAEDVHLSREDLLQIYELM